MAEKPREQVKKGPRPQRNFLRDYDLMLKIMQEDYVDCARYGASGYAEFIGQLYTLNSTMFQSPIYCDHILTQMALHYLAWYQDPSIELVVSPNAAWHLEETYQVQRYKDALYVTSAQPGAPVRVGERIVGVNKKTLDEIRPEVERMLHTTVVPQDPEREDWSLVLACAKHLTVVDAAGEERTIKVVPGVSAVTDRMKRVYAERGEGPALGADAQATLGKKPCSLEESLEPVVSLESRDGVAVLALRDAGAQGFLDALGAALSELGDMHPSSVVLDVRGCTGGALEAIYPLVPWLLGEGVQADPEQVFGRPGVMLNCSRRVIDRRLAELDGLRATLVDADGRALSEESAADLTQVGELMEQLTAWRGTGLHADETNYYEPAVFVGLIPEDGRAVVLVDRSTADAAEWLAKAAKRIGAAGLGPVQLLGRATRGSIDNTCPYAVSLDEDFTLVVPTAKYLSALGDGATLGRGVVPDEHLAWTPEQLERDCDLECACAVARG